MLILDATTKSLEIDLAGAVSANELPVTAHYTDITTTLYTPGSNDTQTNGATAVTIVAAPAASTQRHVESISVYNADTAAATVTIQLNNNSTLRIITKVTLQAAEQLFYEDGMGWQIIDANGAVIRGTNVSDTAYASSWDGVTTIAPSKNAVYDQMQLQMLKTGSNLAIGSDADGDMYYRASGALARLAKGTALYMLRANSAGTAPEWALNYSILGSVAYGNTLRSTRILIENGGDAAHIKCTSTAWFNGDTNVAQDNIGKDAIDTGVWNLDATGAILKLLNTGIVGDIVNSLACQISINYSGTALCVYPTVASGLSMNFTNATTGAAVDLTTLVDTGPIYVLAAYITV
jgi:hypothetical protein